MLWKFHVGFPQRGNQSEWQVRVYLIMMSLFLTQHETHTSFSSYCYQTFISNSIYCLSEQLLWATYTLSFMITSMHIRSQPSNQCNKIILRPHKTYIAPYSKYLAIPEGWLKDLLLKLWELHVQLINPYSLVQLSTLTMGLWACLHGCNNYLCTSNIIWFARFM